MIIIMAKQEFCMLAHVYDPRISIGGWLASEKLDGMRAMWIPSTRGKWVHEIAFANREKDKRKHFCTGLWSRLRKPIFAPSWWLDKLPDYDLDGELWIGRGMFQRVMSACKTLVPGGIWQDVKYMVFDAPKFYETAGCAYIDTLKKLKSLGIENEILKIHDQTVLTFKGATEELETLLDGITSVGGEGIILRRPLSIWRPERSYNLLKVKRFLEGTGKVIGYTSGRKTELGSKLLGMMGALVLLLDNGKILELSGFTESERLFITDDMMVYASEHPGERMPNWFSHLLFPIGAIVRYRYRELSEDGVPKEARYWR